MPFGKWFGHGFNPGGFGPARYFERGILKFMILNLINDQPRHGYDIIQELENKFHGFYSPSAGSVYPILQLLEDQGHVTSSQKDGKKVYTITDDGKKFLSEHEDEISHMRSHLEHHFGEKQSYHFHELRDEVRQTAKLIFQNAASGALKDLETMKQLHEAFEHFRSEIETIFSKQKTEESSAEEK